MLETLFGLLCCENCRGCHRPISSRSRTLTVCEDCWSELSADAPFYEWVPLDDSRAFPLASGTAYDGLAKKLLYHLKYDNDRLIARDLSQPLCRAFEQLAGEMTDSPCLIVPVPLHWRRQYRRRFNQAELLSQEMLRLWRRDADRQSPGLSAPRLVRGLLKRSRATNAHHLLSKEERRVNMEAAFSVDDGIGKVLRPGETLADCTVVIVDDIYTSGATMSEAARTLMKAGAKRVAGLSVARAVLRCELKSGLGAEK